MKDGEKTEVYVRHASTFTRYSGKGTSKGERGNICARKRLRHILVGGKMDIRKREGENNTKGKRIRNVLT
jgi:hypothetical protein